MTPGQIIPAALDALLQAAFEHMLAAQVAFTMLVPCLLLTKVAATLAQQPSSALLAIPLLATAQVAPLAGVWSRAASPTILETSCLIMHQT